MNFFSDIYYNRRYERNINFFQGTRDSTEFKLISEVGCLKPDTPEYPNLQNSYLTYEECAGVFWLNKTTGLTRVNLQGKRYLIGKGMIAEVVGDNIVFPIIASGIVISDIPYYTTLSKHPIRKPTMGCVTTYIHPEMDTPRGPWPGIRKLYKKYMKDELATSHKVILEDPAFIYKKSVPVPFTTKKAKAEYIRAEVMDAIGPTVAGNRNRANE